QTRSPSESAEYPRLFLRSHNAFQPRSPSESAEYPRLFLRSHNAFQPRCLSEFIRPPNLYLSNRRAASQREWTREKRRKSVQTRITVLIWINGYSAGGVWGYCRAGR